MLNPRYLEIVSTDRNRQNDGLNGQNAFSFKIRLDPEHVPNGGFDSIRDVVAVSLMEFVAPIHLISNDQSHIYIRLKYNQRYLKTMDSVAACRDDIFARFSVVTDRSFRSLGSGNLVSYKFPLTKPSHGVPSNRLSSLEITLLDENGCPIQKGQDLYPLDYMKYGATLTQHASDFTGNISPTGDGTMTLNSGNMYLTSGDKVVIEGEIGSVVSVDVLDDSHERAILSFDSGTFDDTTTRDVTWTWHESKPRLSLQSTKHLLLKGDKISVNGYAATVIRLDNESSVLIETTKNVAEDQLTNVTWKRTEQSSLVFTVQNIDVQDQHRRLYRLSLTDEHHFVQSVSDQVLGYETNQYCMAYLSFESGGSRTEHLLFQSVAYNATSHALQIDVVLPFFDPSDLTAIQNNFKTLYLSRFGDSAKPLMSSFLFRFDIRPPNRT